MKDIAIVYSSKCGHTKRYADWLKEDIDADVIALTSFAPNRMASYRLIIFACGVYGDKLSIMDFVKKNITSIPMQKTMVMAVSWYTNDSEEAKQKLIADNYPDQFKHNNVPLFVINSGIDKKLISPTDKVKLVAAKAMIDKKDGRTSDDINTLAIIKGYADQTSKDNLASIKKGIDEFFNPPKPVVPAPAPKPAVTAPESKPVETVSAPTPAPAAAETVQPPKPQEAPKAEKKLVSEEDALSNSVEEAFKNLYAPKPKPAAVAPDVSDVPNGEQSAPVARFNENGEIVVSSIVDAIKTLNGEPVSRPKPKPAPITRVPSPESNEELEAAVEVKPVAEPEPIAKAEPEAAAVPEPVAEEVIPEPVIESEPVVEVVPEPVAEVIPKPAAEPEPVAEAVPEPIHTEPAKPKNSYMELFAKRRRSAAEAASRGESAIPAPPPVTEAVTASEPKPEVKPAPSPKAETAAHTPMVDEFNIADFILEEKPKEYISAPSQNTSYDEDDFGGFEFINEDKPTVSKRAMNAVQDLAKAKEAAEREAAKKAAANEALAAEPNTPAAKNDILEKMRHDIEALAEESEYTQNYDVEDETYTEPEAEVTEPSVYNERAEEDTDGLEAFAFTDNADYDLDSEFIEPPKLEDMDAPHESKTNFDIRKLQEEINASIETNRAAKEKMMARQSKKQKEASHNPFAVQFEDDEETKKSKKSKKQQAIGEPKRLADPIDPDIFFSRNNSKNQDFNTGTMPEIKFKNQR